MVPTMREVMVGIVTDRGWPISGCEPARHVAQRRCR